MTAHPEVNMADHPTEGNFRVADKPEVNRFRPHCGVRESIAEGSTRKRRRQPQQSTEPAAYGAESLGRSPLGVMCGASFSIPARVSASFLSNFPEYLCGHSVTPGLAGLVDARKTLPSGHITSRDSLGFRWVWEELPTRPRNRVQLPP
jgi:hypothetical protein